MGGDARKCPGGERGAFVRDLLGQRGWNANLALATSARNGAAMWSKCSHASGPQFKTPRQLAIDHGCNSSAAPKHRHLHEWMDSEPKDDILVLLHCRHAAELASMPAVIKNAEVDMFSKADCERVGVLAHHARFRLRSDCVGGHLSRCYRLYGAEAAGRMMQAFAPRKKARKVLRRRQYHQVVNWHVGGSLRCLASLGSFL